MDQTRLCNNVVTLTQLLHLFHFLTRYTRLLRKRHGHGVLFSISYFSIRWHINPQRERDRDKPFLVKLGWSKKKVWVESVQARARGAGEVAKELCEANRSTIGALISNPCSSQNVFNSLKVANIKEEIEKGSLITV